MKRIKGKPLPLGVEITENTVNFSVSVPDQCKCLLLLYESGKKEPLKKYDMLDTMGEVRYLALTDIDPCAYEYNYLIDQVVVVDPYAKALAGRKTWGKACDVQKHEVRGVLYDRQYDWEGDAPLNIPYHEIIAYSLHVRGFTQHVSSKAVDRGTFLGVIEKIPYMQSLGINQIHCMPVYEFEECQTYINYWGYGDAYPFAPKSAYAASGDGVKELKDMVKACHKARIEVVLEMPFTLDVPKQMIEECLRYYMMEYHIDGFILNPCVSPLEGISADPILKKTKLMRHDLGFQTIMRRFLKGDEGMVGEVMHWLKHRSEHDGTFNYIAGHSGFTLNDVVSYDGKHNEKNGENNQDGPEYNYSWNCGAEGPSRKKEVKELRKKQMRNAFFLLLFGQGTPCILAGDEFANTQKGNNNVYCQDNATGWLDWGRLESEAELFTFVRELIAVRRTNPVFCQERELMGMDQMSCGVPDVSYHGANAWKEPSEVSSRQLGIYYHMESNRGEDCFVAYNMHWLPHSFALPALAKGKKWHRAASTKEGVVNKPELLKNQRMVELKERTVIILIGR